MPYFSEFQFVSNSHTKPERLPAMNDPCNTWKLVIAGASRQLRDRAQNAALR